MPLRDAFRFPRDPLVQNGVISRRQNWDLRLGSLAAALGGMNQPGGLGQALAQAGAIYQDQRRGVMADVIAQAQEEAKRAREEEMFRLTLEREERALRDQEMQEADRAASKQDAVRERAARTLAAAQRGLPTWVADSPTFAYEIQKHDESLKPPKVEKPQTFHFGSEGGTLVTIGPDGQLIQQRVSGQPEALTPQEQFLRDKGYDPRDPAAKERYLRDEGLLQEGGGGLTAKGKIDLVTRLAGEILDAAPKGIDGEPSMSFEDALRKAQDTASGLIKSYELDSLPKGIGGRTVAGLTLPAKGGTLPSANGEMTVIQTPRLGKLDDDDKAALLKIQEMLKSVPDPKQRTALMAQAMRENQQGKSWSMLYAEMTAP